MAVVGKDYIMRINAVFCRPDRPAAAVAVEFEYWSIFVDSSAIPTQTTCKTANMTRALKHCCARCKEARHIVAAASEFEHRLGIQHLAGLAETLKMIGIAAVETICLGTGRAVHLARRIKIGAVDAVVL